MKLPNHSKAYSIAKLLEEDHSTLRQTTVAQISNRLRKFVQSNDENYNSYLTQFKRLPNELKETVLLELPLAFALKITSDMKDLSDQEQP
jgi:hypothetical protein